MMATVIDTYEKMAQRAVVLQKLRRPTKGNDTADANRRLTTAVPVVAA
jgi:hypothetical protein